MADYLSDLRLQNMFPGTQEPPVNFGGPQGYDFTGPNLVGPEIQSIPGNLGSFDLGSPYGQSEGYGDMFTGPMQSPETSSYNIDQRMNQLYSPESMASDKLTEMLGGYPQRPAPKTGWGGALQKIGAVAGGMTGGMDLFNEVMAPGHAQKVTDWRNQIGPTQQSAQIERQTNVNERQMAMSTIASELRQQAADAKQKNDTTNAQIRQHRADVYEYKAKNPNIKILATKGGNVMAVDPATGEVKDLGIPSGTLSDADKMALTQENALQKIQETGAQGRETESLRQTGRVELAGVRGDETRQTNSEKPIGPGANKSDTPGQNRTRQVSKANEIRNTRPDLRPFINVTGNSIDVTTPSVPGKLYGQTAGPTAEQHAEIQRLLYGAPDTDRRAPVMEKIQRNAATGQTRTVISRDGGKTWQPK